MTAWQWFLHHFGIDDTTGAWYAFWSGFGSDLGEVTLVVAVIAWYRHHTCHVKGCRRMGHPDPEHGHPICHRHQPKLGKDD